DGYLPGVAFALDVRPARRHTPGLASGSQPEKLGNGGKPSIMEAIAFRLGTAVLLAGLLLTAGCKGEDRDRLARVGRKIVGRVASLTPHADDNVRQGWQALQGGWEDATVAARVATR